MLTRSAYLPGVPCWIEAAVPDVGAAAAFYGGLFGWTFEDRAAGSTDGPYLVARLHGCDVAAIADGSAARWTTYVRVDDADAAAAAAGAAGGRVEAGPFDVSRAGRAAYLTDPAGAAIAVWQPREHAGAQLVNAPGTWNWSTLRTPDRDAAERFYAALFGWEADRLDLGGGAATLLRLPGYGDHLAALDRGLRDRHAQPGVPPGFSDAVAWIEAGDGPARWALTFAVDDADAAARRAAELGGDVLAAPFDAGPVRVAELRDPFGVPFSVSRYAAG